MLPERPEPGLTSAAVAAAACLSALLILAIVHAVRAPYPAGDDMTWLRHASAGLGTIWSGPSPFHHFRPSFGTWLAFWQAAGLGAPRGLALASLALHAAGGAAAYALFRAVAPPATSLLAATLFLVHPAREQHLLWASAQIDGLGTALALAALALSLRARGLARGGRFAALLGVALLTFLAALAKETGLLLPLVLVACPLPAGRRLGMVGASAAGALAAATLALWVLGGLGRAAPILEAASPRRLPLYPTRLVWPGDLVGWTRALRVDHDPLPLAACLLATLAVGGFVLLAALRRRGEAMRLALVLVGAGAIPWLVRPHDRGIGLGVAGAALLLGLTASRRVAALGLLAIAAAWSPLWIRAEESWTEAKAIGVELAGSLRAWRDEAGPSVLLIALGVPGRAAFTSEVAGTWEIDSCATDVLPVEGSIVPSRVHREAGDRVRIEAAAGSVLAWAPGAAPEQGFLELRRDGAGGIVTATVDLDALRGYPWVPGCEGAEVRYWTGAELAPLPPPGEVETRSPNRRQE